MALGMSREMTRRRLRVLFNKGLIDVLVDGQERDNAHVITRRGAKHLARVFGRAEKDFKVLRTAKYPSEHHAAAVDVYVGLRCAALRSTRLTLTRFIFEREIRGLLGNPRGAQVPDAVAVFEDESGERVAWAIEIDCGSENPSWFAKHKVEPYSELRTMGQPLLGCGHWVVTCVVTGPHTLRRVHRLAAAAWSTGAPEGLFYFATHPVNEGLIFRNAAWVTPRMVGEGNAQLVRESPLGTVGTTRRNRADGSEGVKPHHEGVLELIELRPFAAEDCV